MKLFQDGLMELEPVVEIVQVDGIRKYTAIVIQSIGSQDIFANLVRVDVADDRDIQLVDIALGEIHAGLLLDPSLELRIGGLLFRDEGLYSLGLKAQGADDHHVVALADARVSWGQLPAGFERNFLPQAWQVQDAQGTGLAGGDERNVGLAHVDSR